ncbi:MAG: nitronate monooxygenase family protein [Caulobacteraceae bacterium]
MPLPTGLQERLAIPAIAAPMFLTSGPDLVVECCRSGVLGTFPALNPRTSQGFAAWVEEIEARLAAVSGAAPYGVNLIVHRTNPRLQADLEIVVKHKAPVIITSLGAVKEVVDAVHSYGGMIFHDVISRRHAEKAAAAGVDGIIGVAAGAGGHAGTLSPFALLAEIRQVFDGILILSGAMNTGRDIAAARMMGADLAYLGSRFIATRESLVGDDQKQMMLESQAADVIYTPKVSGVNANFLRGSLEEAGILDDDQPGHVEMNMNAEARAWKTVWSAGQGVGSIRDVPPAAELCARLISEYRTALREVVSDPFAAS